MPPQSSFTEWHVQLQHRITSLEALRATFPSLTITLAMQEAANCFPMAITPYYASLIQIPDFSDPIFAQCVPQGAECNTPDWLSLDPLHEQHSSPVPGLIHRYPDRALLLATSACATYCRHCTRKRVAATPDSTLASSRLPAILQYLTQHPEIDDVLISGGDPMLLEDDALIALLRAIRTIESVKVIRIATRTLVTLPMRFTSTLVERLRPFAPLFVNTHFNHPRELTQPAIEAANRLTNAGIPVGNQTVLLRGINDSPTTIERLCRALFHNRIRPYYLFQCDLVKGIEHLRTPLSTGLEIMQHLRGRLSGLAIPNFALDTPEGGKIELLPNAILRTTTKGTYLQNSQNKTLFYPDP